MLVECNAIDKAENSVYTKQHTPSDEQPAEYYSPPIITLDTDGYIQSCNKSVEELFGYLQHELLLHHVSCLFPKLTRITMMQGNRLNPLFNYICHCDHVFKALNKQCNIITCNLNFLLVENDGKLNLRMIVRPVANVQS
jgi:PAS domain S-box-containing protein